MSAPAPAGIVSRAAARRPVFRRDIQALRALAIGLVVLNHLWPGRLSGGYVGVDVFFVISGFLITGHLLGEVEKTGRVRLAAFYARRVRRLLPAAVVVLVVTLLGVWWLLPHTRWADNALQAIASAFYVENWVLSSLSINYSAHNASASAVQHFWSLSVEEQFYLLWPVLLLVTALLTIRFLGPGKLRRGILIAVLVVGAGSLVASVLFTAFAPAQAYFVTFTRAWQFAAGALVALVPAAVFGRLNALVASAVAVVGYALIGVAALTFDAQTAYPGAAALLPVLGTAAVIVAGTGRRAPLWGVSAVTDLRPVQWLGDVSYSLYLWHWPLIVLMPFLIVQPLSAWSKAFVLAVSLILAWASRRWIEKPPMRAGWWKRTSRAFIGAGAMMLTVLLLGALLSGGAAIRSDQASAETVSTGACHGPRALDAGSGCDPAAPVADPVVTERDAYFGLAPECGDLGDGLMIDGRQTTRTCDFSEADDRPRVWLVGDSHAEQWQAAIFPIAAEQGWDLTISSFPGCPPADVSFTGFDSPWGPADYQRCRDWAGAVSDEIVKEKPDLVITSMAARQQLVDDQSDRPHDAQFIDGLRRTWGTWTTAGVRVLPIADTPLNGDVRDLDCLVLNASEPQKCEVPRAAASPADPIALAVQDPMAGVWPMDFTASLCDASVCFAAVGGEPVFYDADHLSSAYSRLLSTQLEEVVDRALSSPAPGGS
ncbi:acyltransferase family protein [Microbacterium sp. ZW T5_45]|uniref:acyltransferase family protein n=1 Tax=Microbacterium sp. ZW T5_45 TaxID=3378080 RepID=UPI003853E494